MKSYGRFTVNPESGKFEADESSFVSELAAFNGEPGYYYPHFFDGNSIKSYGAFTIIRNGTENLEYFRSVYGIYPTKAYKLRGGADEIHLVFDMDIGITKEEYLQVSKALQFVYGGVPSEFHYYWDNPNFVETVISDGPKFSSASSSALRNLMLMISDKGVERNVTKAEMEDIAKVNALDITEVAKDIGRPDDEKFDEVNNVSPKYGYAYELIVNTFPLPSRAREFMNSNYGTSFVNRIDASQYGIFGEKVLEGTDFFLDEIGYYCLKQNDKARQTDFFVNVHYKIRKPTETSYVVSLVNENTGDKSHKFEWPNVVNRSTLSEFLQKLGNYHFIGGQSFITSFHSKLSEFREVPEIVAILGYGFHKELGILVLENGIFDLKQKIFTRKTNTDDEFMFNYDGKGYLVIDKHGTSLKPIMKGLVPQLREEKLVEVDDAVKFLSKLYSDDSGKLLLMAFFGNMGYSMFANIENVTDKFPIFFVRGLTGSGKTTYVDLLQRMWGIRDGAKSFQQTSNFTISILISYLRYVPMFLSEFRDTGSDVKVKGATIRSMFDGTGQAKGRPDQTIVNYDYKSTMVMEGQEMFRDEALRTRSIQHRFLSSHKISGDFAKLFKEGNGVLDGMLYTYLNLASKDDYLEAMEEGYSLFRKVSRSNRICDNLKMLYAGCMAIDKKRKDEYVRLLMEVGKFQNEDYMQNSESVQIIKVMARFVEQASGFDDVYVSRDNVVISWGAFEEYARMKRIDMDLRVDTYQEHLQEMGFEIGYEELVDRMVSGIIIPKELIPKEFLTSQVMYEAWKSRKKVS